jgi:hypothetical protein
MCDVIHVRGLRGGFILQVFEPLKNKKNCKDEPRHQRFNFICGHSIVDADVEEQLTLKTRGE